MRRSRVSAHHHLVENFERRAGDLASRHVKRNGEELSGARVHDVPGRRVHRGGSAGDERLLLSCFEVPEIDARIVVAVDALEGNRIDQRIAAWKQTRKAMTAFAV